MKLTIIYSTILIVLLGSCKKEGALTPSGYE
jgi:hypothetical protein